MTIAINIVERIDVLGDMPCTSSAQSAFGPGRNAMSCSSSTFAPGTLPPVPSPSFPFFLLIHLSCDGVHFREQYIAVYKCSMSIGAKNQGLDWRSETAITVKPSIRFSTELCGGIFMNFMGKV